VAISNAAFSYLNVILGLMQANSIKRPTIDWTAFRNSVMAEAGAAQTIADLNPAIRLAIMLLGDGHSSYRGAGHLEHFRRHAYLQGFWRAAAVAADIDWLRQGDRVQRQSAVSRSLA